MKKLLSFVIFLFVTFVFSNNLKAQTSFREPVSSQMKADDGVLVAYPNPARDFIIVKSKIDGLKIKQVSFYSILGVKVAEFAVNMSAGEINLDKLQPGKYLMRYLMTNNTQKVIQVVKQ